MSLLSGKDRTLVGRPVFKTGGGRQTSLVGSIPTLFRQRKANEKRGQVLFLAFLLHDNPRGSMTNLNSSPKKANNNNPVFRFQV